MVHRPGVPAQPDPGAEEDAVPPLLAQPGHTFALAARPAADISPQVRHRWAAFTARHFRWDGFFLRERDDQRRKEESV